LLPWFFSDGRVNAISWATDHPGGFGDADLRLFEEILPTYSTIVEVKSLRRFATNVLSTYVGREPGELIMKGQIRRGDVRTLRAALMMVDLRDYTGLSDALPPAEVIAILIVTSIASFRPSKGMVARFLSSWGTAPAVNCRTR